MQVQDIMSSPVFTVTFDTPVSQVAGLLHENHFTGVPVIDGEGQVLGMITEREFFSKDFKLHLPTYLTLFGETDFVPNNGKLPHVVEQIAHAKAGDIMNKSVVFLAPDETAEKAAGLFARSGQNPIPVTDSKNRILGIVSRSDLIKLFSNAQVTPNPKLQDRAVDQQLRFVEEDVSARLASVAKARANVWVTTLIVLIVIACLAIITYSINPDILKTRPSSKIAPKTQVPR